jgi:hypothetical protein
MAHEEVFNRLGEILAPYQGRLAVLADGPTSYELGAPTLPARPPGSWRRSATAKPMRASIS